MEAVDLQELKRKAEAVLARSEAIGEDAWYDSTEICIVGGDKLNSADAVFIQAASPEAVSSLIAEVESLRKQLEEANEARHFNARMCVQLQQEIFQLKGSK